MRGRNIACGVKDRVLQAAVGIRQPNAEISRSAVKLDDIVAAIMIEIANSQANHITIDQVKLIHSPIAHFARRRGQDADVRGGAIHDGKVGIGVRIHAGDDHFPRASPHGPFGAQLEHPVAVHVREHIVQVALNNDQVIRHKDSLRSLRLETEAVGRLSRKNFDRSRIALHHNQVLYAAVG